MAFIYHLVEKGVATIKNAVDIDSWPVGTYRQIQNRVSQSNEPNWAYNYLSKNDLLGLLLVIKKTKRQGFYLELLKATGKESFADNFKCNARGQVVFKWDTASERTMFILKWS